jgi:pyruvate dehydrogenase E1 component beta subunit
MRELSYGQAVNEAMHVAMANDAKVISYGLGICDPKAVFGTTQGLQEAFGSERVFDMPVSENALTGIAVGAALAGYKPVMTHQRVDFTLVAMDQIVNAAAKWFYMFGGQTSVPIVIRMIIGRGWGQGPTHSQALHSWYSHIPGLKVILPTTPADAKGMLIEAIHDPNPVIMLEHRWLHATRGDVPKGDYRVPLGKASVLRQGTDVTIVATSLMSIEAVIAAKALASQGVSCEIIDMRTTRPIDWDQIKASVQKTGHLVALDVSHTAHSVASEVVAHITENCFKDLKAAPKRVCLPDHAVPTSQALTENFYPDAGSVIAAVAEILGRPLSVDTLERPTSPHDVPGTWFNGPF